MKFSFITATTLLILGLSSKVTEIKLISAPQKFEDRSSVVLVNKQDEDRYVYSQGLLNRFKHIAPNLQLAESQPTHKVSYEKNNVSPNPKKNSESEFQNQVPNKNQVVYIQTTQTKKDKSNLNSAESSRKEESSLISVQSQNNYNTSVIDTKGQKNIIGKVQNRTTGQGNIKQGQTGMISQRDSANSINYVAKNSFANNIQGQGNLISAKSHLNEVKGNNNFIGKQSSQNIVIGQGNMVMGSGGRKNGPNSEIEQFFTVQNNYINHKSGNGLKPKGNLIATNSYINQVEGQGNIIKTNSHLNTIKGNDNIIGKNASQNLIIGKGNIINDGPSPGAFRLH